MKMTAVNAKFFATPALWRAWLKGNYDKASEVWVGFYKRSSGKPSIIWSEAVDQALCFGWIDGIRISIDALSYRIRFTPRRPGSTWSTINVKKITELSRQGLMRDAGLKAFQQRESGNSGVYSYEQRHSAKLSAAQARQFRAQKKAWDFFQQQPPGYRRITIFWVVSAKKDETRAKRLATLITESENGRRIGLLRQRER